MASHATETSGAPVETPPPHTPAYMDMEARRGLWRAFGKSIEWSSLILVMTLGYATFTLTMGVNWLPALIGFAGVGIIAGLLLKMGGAWFATVFGLGVLAFIIQIFVWITHALL
ncbi:aa3-type cytochrome c oxidase subunit IV [bacterium]|nr:aa3-type cytochrome c oxidase subunit IV [bacterium]